ncbi:hypothetical protein EG328_003626 [Venturia inaequalis]|uniref:Uncharacterized protein n=1 Tax=Venturia inaequalis TaxID=5025 RepID=A0A8H3VGN9_VENIN|nr:hypothetical protein EG328_003626 [Venturia inaequalis]RDI86130.1 hypothetical protein Vi05172_g3773 [Venturia inaequalis]
MANPNRLSSSPEGAQVDRHPTIEHNVRSMPFDSETQAASSVYEGTPLPDQSQPKPSPRELFGQVRELAPTSATFLTSTSSPILNHHVPGMTYSPATQPSEWSRTPQVPAPVVSPEFRHPADNVFYPVDPLQRDPEAAASRYPRGQRKRRRRRRRQGAWVHEGGTRQGSVTLKTLAHGYTRMKFMAVLISGLFLACIGTIYLTLNLTMRNSIPQELHILFVLALLGTVAFFSHSAIRLWIMAHKGNLPSYESSHHNRIPSTAGPEGFKPSRPIPVQLARDDEIAALDEEGCLHEEKLETTKMPPPAYGLWRESVRIDPNLLHWQRVRDATEAENTRRRNRLSHDSVALVSNFGSPALGYVREEEEEESHQNPQTQEGLSVPRMQQARPPSYASDDGVSYVVSALPGRPPSEIHPALRVRLP